MLDSPLRALVPEAPPIDTVACRGNIHIHAVGENLRYAKETKRFFANAKKVGQDFLVKSCEIRNV